MTFAPRLVHESGSALRHAQSPWIEVGREMTIPPFGRPRLVWNPAVDRIEDRAPASGTIHRLGVLFKVFAVADTDATPMRPGSPAGPSGVRGGLKVFAFSTAQRRNSAGSSGQTPDSPYGRMVAGGRSRRGGRKPERPGP